MARDFFLESPSKGERVAEPKKVLVIDDDVEMTLLMKDILRRGNYEVAVAHNGLEAIEKSRQGNIHLILLDIRMPLFSGLWFCDVFKQKPQTKHIPVVIVSASSAAKDIRRARDVGAATYLKKPFRPAELLQVVEKNILK